MLQDADSSRARAPEGMQMAALNARWMLVHCMLAAYVPIEV